MGIRADQKTQLKNFLQAITFEGANLVVKDYYTSDNSVSPYIFITSAEMNKPFLIDTGSHEEVRYYNLIAVFAISEDTDQSVLASRIDNFEDLIVAKMETRAVKDGIVSGTIELEEISSPFQDDVNVQDNNILKVFKIKFQSVNLYV